MHKHHIAIAAAFGLLAAAPALAEDWDFILINNSGKPIKTIEVSPAGAGTWVANKVDPDVKREAEIKAGGRTTVHFDKGSGCKYDVKAGFADGTSGVWSAIDICANSFVTIGYKGTTPVVTAN